MITSHELVDTTAECVKLINDNYKMAKWKRVAKFNLFNGLDELHTARVFTDEKEFVTLVSIQNRWNDRTLICRNLHIGTLKPLITAIRVKARTLYTHDYGQIFLNPYTMKLWVVGGDGGIFESNKRPEVVARMFEEGDPELYDQDIDNPKFDIEQLSSVDYEAEYFPPFLDGEDEDGNPKDQFTTTECYLLIGQINDVCNIEPAGGYSSPVDDGMTRLERMTIDELQKELNTAIQAENYEYCVEIKKELDKRKS